MQIQIKSGNSMEGQDALAAQVTEVVESALSLVRDCISRVEVQLNDEKGDKPGQRCVMETRLAGRQSIAVTHRASTLVQAVEGAADKLTQLIESTLGRRRHQENSWADSPLDWQ